MVGNTAEDYRVLTGIPDGRQSWQRLKRFRNDLAHRRLHDINDDWVWPTSTLCATPLRDLVRALLRESGDPLEGLRLREAALRPTHRVRFRPAVLACRARRLPKQWANNLASYAPSRPAFSLVSTAFGPI